MANTASVVLQSVEGDGVVFQARTQDGNAFLMDSPARPQAPSPIETLLAALGGCAGMDVIAILRKQRQVVLGYEVALSGERRAEHPRARRPGGRLSATSANIAGEARLPQAEASSRPRKRNGHEGAIQ